MAFTPKVWENAPSTDTPLNAAGLIDLEERVTDYADTLTVVNTETIASASTIAPADDTSTAVISGTTTITTITPTFNGHELSLRFSSTAQLTDGSNLKLNGNFTGVSDRTITLLCNGTNWYELSRSDNGTGPGTGIELGYAEITSSFTQTGAGTSDVTGLSTTVTVASRPVVIHVWGSNFHNTNDAGITICRLQEGSTILASSYANFSANTLVPLNIRRRLAPSAGSHTYKVVLSQFVSGNSVVEADSGTTYGPAFIHVTEV